MKTAKMSQTNLSAQSWADVAPSADERHRRTLVALAQVDAGLLIEDEAIWRWVDSWDTDAELPPPQSE